MWIPQGANRISRSVPSVGAVIAWDYAVWHVLSTRPQPESEWEPWERKVWAYCGSPDPWTEAPYEVELVPAAGGERVVLTVRRVAIRNGRPVYVYDNGIWEYEDPEHYPICACCHGPIPCRTKHAERVAKAAAAREAELAAKATSGAMCCGGEITPGQKLITFPGPNLRAPTAPPPIFHARKSCRYEVRKYEQVWLRANPGQRARYSCPGQLYRHVDGWQCSEPACPGPDVHHQEKGACPGNAGGTRPCRRCADALARGDVLPEQRRPRRKDRFADPAPLAGWVIPAATVLDLARAHAVDPSKQGDRLPVIRKHVVRRLEPIDGVVLIDRGGLPGALFAAPRAEWKETIQPGREWPAGATRGWSACGRALLADELWVPYAGGDPEADGKACPDCLTALTSDAL